MDVDIREYGFASESDMMLAINWLFAEACLHEAKRRLRRGSSETELLSEAKLIARDGAG